MTFLMAEKWYLTVVLICISLMTNDIEHSASVLTFPLSLDPVLQSFTILFMLCKMWPHLCRSCLKCSDSKAGFQLGWDQPVVGDSQFTSSRYVIFFYPASSWWCHPYLQPGELLRFCFFHSRWSQLFQPCPVHFWSAGTFFPPKSGWGQMPP